ncbi:protein TolR [Mariluticola halotolerans]|uniref:protein TolR n=1 Tax=Mariluticola halotolerans TaxID=2909283 RepID=UPI0026E2AF3D|nr:protein TolR [Mariluticola halotolerans]UJQ94056.1 protein TolR [Mariluticola halotolerans]
MGMSVGAGKTGRRRGRRGRSAPMSEINVTPMVDVMLVLLIVFMVAAPLLTVGVPIDLPETQAKSLNTEAKPITVSVTPEGQVYLLEDVVPVEELVARINEIAVNGTDERIYVRGDASAGYGTVMQVMGALSGAGYSKIGLITEQVQGQ